MDREETIKEISKAMALAYNDAYDTAYEIIVKNPSIRFDDAAKAAAKIATEMALKAGHDTERDIEDERKVNELAEGIIARNKALMIGYNQAHKEYHLAPLWYRLTRRHPSTEGLEGVPEKHYTFKKE